MRNLISWSIIMFVAPKLPMKFYCASCKSIYLQPYQAKARLFYPHCPQCQQPGQLQGTVETQDFIKHPIPLIKSYLQGLSRSLNS